MKRLFYGLVLLILLPAPLVAQTVEQDASYRKGKLENGLTYYIRHNAKDPGLADFYIAQRVGSILEEPRQRGLAHFLEHMAFNGTKHFSGKDGQPGIVPWCETIGVKFGANLNAYTSVDQTVYNISSVPVTHEGVIDSTLLILHDWSHFLLLTDEEIDKERGVIHEEWRTRRAGMASQRMMELVMPVIYQGTKYEDCLPIGSMDIVDNFPYQDLRDYYQKWYRPDLQAIIVVGDIDVDRMEQKIKALFGPIEKAKNPAERIYYPVSDNERMIVAVEKDSEQPIFLATLYMKRDATPDSEKDQLQYQRDDYVDGLISYMIGGRLQELQHQAVPPCLSASGRVGQFFVSRTKDAFSLSFGCRQENIRGSFDAAIAEAERARRYGFTQSELDRAKALYNTAADRQYAERNDRRNSYYIRKALQNFLASEPILTAEYDRQLVNRFAEEVTLDEVNAATRNIISNHNQVLVLYAPDKPEAKVPSNEELEQYVLEAQARDYEPYKEEMLAQTFMSELPQPGTIVSEKSGGQFGFTEITLSNGVKVFVKPTTLAKDEISMRLFRKGGTCLYPDEDFPNFSFIRSAITKGGVGQFDEITLRKMLTGKIVRVSPQISDEVEAINGSSSVKDFESMLQLTHLYFTQPRQDSIAFNGEINRMRSFLTNREASPTVSYNDSLMSIVYGNSPRVQPVKKEMLNLVSLDRIMEIYKERFASAEGFQMVLIGNIDMEILRPLLCQYIASLPVGSQPAAGEEHPYPDVVEGNFTRKFTKKMNTPSAQVTIFYTFEEPFSLKSDLELDIFKRVLQIAYTDSIREEKGGTYGVSIDFDLNEDSNPHALVKISFRTDPAKYDELIPLVYQQVEHIAKQGPIASSMEKVKKYLTKAYGQNVTHNDYWDYLIYNYLRHGIDYDTGYLQTLEAVTPDDIRRVASDLLQSNRRIEITMISE